MNQVKDNRKNVIVRLEPEFFKRLKVHLALNGKTLQSYLTELIEKDLNSQADNDKTKINGA